jgi:hypothetical protein
MCAKQGIKKVSHNDHSSPTQNELPCISSDESNSTKSPYIKDRKKTLWSKPEALAEGFDVILARPQNIFQALCQQLISQYIKISAQLHRIKVILEQND